MVHDVVFKLDENGKEFPPTLNAIDHLRHFPAPGLPFSVFRAVTAACPEGLFSAG